MSISVDNTSPAARQVSMALRQLTTVATLPETISGLLAELSRSGVTPAATAIINSDPALTAMFLSMDNGSKFTAGSNWPSVAEKFASLSAAEIESMILSVEISQQDPNASIAVTLSHRELVLHSIATACAAGLIADIALPAGQHQLAYTAGLLHDIGKLALDSIMPKSFQRIIDSAQSNNQSAHIAEFAHLEMDHAIIGKRLAEKWNFAEPVVHAVWLHHTDTQSLSSGSGDYRFVRVIKLADIIARQSGIGSSGSFDKAEVSMKLLESLQITTSQLDEIVAKLPGIVTEKADLLGINTDDAASILLQALRETAASLADEKALLQSNNRKLFASSLQVDFVQQLFEELNPGALPIDIACRCASLWQEQYQTGPVCLYFVSDNNDMTIEMVSIDNSGKAATFLPKLSGEIPVVPSEIQDRFDIIDAYEKSNWILRQTDLDCDISKMRMLPLLHCGIAVGALIFEHRQGEPSMLQQKHLFEMPATVIAATIAQAVSSQKNSYLAERFVAMLSANRQPIERPAGEELSSLDGIAEMAAGAAHELNNPLAVISGRTQLLAAGETDPEKKKTLAQIQSRAEEISSIVSQMMRFAQPQNPSRQKFPVVKMITAAGELVAVAHRLDSLQMSISGMDDLTIVNVDPDQIVAVLTAVLSNALESYENGNGPIEVTAECPQKPGMEAMLIRDHGRGMDSETAAKATMPFFSAKPAGRKRGMGLANAQRLISANEGTMKITSIPGKGTTVRIELPLS